MASGLSEGRLHSSRFEVEAKLGEGGMGTVYEAVDRERQARVALKALRHLGAEEIQRFKGEFRKLQDLHHPNLVSLGELVEEAGQWFFTMELVRGVDLLSYVRPTGMQAGSESLDRQTPASGARPEDPTLPPARAPSDEQTLRLERRQAPAEPSALPSGPGAAPHLGFDERRLRSALGQLSLGLHALHRAGKVHRDIKPSNILVTSEGRVVLLDFGILSDLEAEQPSEPSSIFGTAAYMAPEQAGGAAPSPEADWYSVGVLLYQVLTGRRPLEGNAQALLELKRRVEPRPPQALVAGLPEDLCQLCVALLRRAPASRPGGEEVLRRLGVAQQAREEAWSTLSLPFVGRHAELAALRRALEDSRRGSSVVVLVEGESGVGKTRLVKHFLEEVAETYPEAVVLAGRCYERESAHFKGVDGIVEALARHLSSQGHAEAAGVVPTGAAPLLQLFPILRRVGPLAGQAEAAVPQEPLQLRLAAFSLLRELLGRVAARHPVVLVVDDLQWADRDGTALLDELLQAPGLLLVSTLRATTLDAGRALEEAGSRFWQHARVLELQGLSAEEALALVQRIQREGTHLSPGDAARIAQESSGHPLFIEALVRHPRTGAAQPLHLEAALWVRASHLEDSARQLLELLAVASGPLSHAVAMHASALGAVEYSRATSSLRGAHLAVTTGPASRDTLEVLHDRVRQAVLPHLSERQRRGWHARLASSLELVRQGEPEALALHWREASQVGRAVRYYLQAARAAEEALAFSRAASLYRTVLELQDWEPAERRQYQVALAEALSHAGRGPEAAQAFLAAARGLEESAACSLERRAGEQYLLSGHLEQGLALLRKVLASASIAYPESRRAALASMLWQRMKLRLRPLRFQLREAHTLPATLLERLELLATAAHGLGGFASLQAYDFQARYLQLALQAGESRHLCRALCFEMAQLAAFGPRNRVRVQRLERLLEQELLPRLEGDAATCGLATTFMAFNRSFLGELTAARPYVDRALALLQRCAGAHWERATLWGIGGGILAMRGELDELNQLFALPLAEARERGDLLSLASMELNCGTLRRLARDEPQVAREAADEVISLCTRQGYAMQSYGHLMSHLYVDLYEGHGQRVLDRLAEAWAGLRRAYVLKLPGALSRVLDVRARAALMEAARGGAQAAARLGSAEADARALARLEMPSASGMAELVRAGLASAHGAPGAAQAYGRAAAALEEAGLLLHAAAARVRQGELLGGEAGHALIQSGRGWMERRGVVHIERMCALYAPMADRQRRRLPPQGSPGGSRMPRPAAPGE